MTRVRHVVFAVVVALMGTASAAHAAFYFDFDYTYDSEGYFDVPERRTALETAGRLLERYTDELAAIEPTDVNTWTAFFAKPDGSGQIFFPSIEIPQNALRVYAAGRPLPGRLAQAIDMGAVGAGDPEWVELVDTRGQLGVLDDPQTDFASIGGSISFNSDFDEFKWHFGTETDGLNANEFDFITIAMHELMHLLGFGVAPSFAALVDAQSNFIGEHSRAVGSPTNPDLTVDVVGAHWESGTEGIWNGTSQEALMAPGIFPGRRTYPSDLDLASLVDVGWQPALAGDANRDGLFNTRDFLKVFEAGLYETELLATWGDGDWNNDGVFGSGDLIAALDTGRYEQPAEARAVPEPVGAVWFVFAFITCFAARRQLVD